MGWGNNNDDDWEPTSMCQPDPGSRAYYENDSSSDHWTKKAKEDGYFECLNRFKRWLELLEAKEIATHPVQLDSKTLIWLTEHRADIDLEFPSETKARLAKESAAAIKEAEALEARAKQLREKAARAK